MLAKQNSVYKQENSGTHIINWDLNDSYISSIQSGIYFIRIKAENLVKNDKNFNNKIIAFDGMILEL